MFHSAQPRHRYYRIYNRLRQTGSCATDDPVEEAVVRLLLGDLGVPEEVLRACSTYWDSYKREVVEAFLLAEATAKDLYSVFRIEESVTEVYAKIFFDMSVFHDRLDIESYARDYTEDDFGHDIKVSAVEDGLEYLKARFGRAHYTVSPLQAVREAISQSYVNTKVAQKFELDSAKSKEARKWASVMVKGIESLPAAKEVEGSQSSDYLLKLKLLREKGERDADDADLEDEIDINPEDIVSRRTESDT